MMWGQDPLLLLWTLGDVKQVAELVDEFRPMMVAIEKRFGPQSGCWAVLGVAIIWFDLVGATDAEVDEAVRCIRAEKARLQNPGPPS